MLRAKEDVAKEAAVEVVAEPTIITAKMPRRPLLEMLQLRRWVAAVAVEEEEATRAGSVEEEVVEVEEIHHHG